MLPIPKTPGKSSMERRLRSGKSVSGKESSASGRPDGPDGEPENTYPFMLFEQEPVEKLKARLKYLEQSGWIDDSTTQIALKMILVNQDVELIQRVIITFIFPETGGIYSKITIQSSFLRAWKTWIVIISDIITLCLLAHITYVEIHELRQNMDTREAIKDYFTDFWNCLDWGTIIMGWIITCMFLDERLRNMELSTYMKSISASAPDVEYWERMYTMHTRADFLAWVNMWWRLLLVYFMLLVMCRFFKAFKGQPRLAVVTNTIYSAASDLFHFGLIFICVFLTFAFAGTILFGRRMAGFSSFKTAFGTSFAIACGDFDWTSMSYEHYTTSSIWFWSFMVLIFLIMLNMVLAIVMDVYTKVRASAMEGDPIWVNAAKIMGKLRKNRYLRLKGGTSVEDRSISETDILRALEGLGSKVTVERLAEAVPGLSYDQALRLMQDADFFEKRNGSVGLSISDAMRVIQRINKKVDDLVLQTQHSSMMAYQAGGGDIAYRVIEKRMLKTKVKRLMVQALWDGTLRRVCADLQSPEMMDQIRNKELQRKMQKADDILLAKKRGGKWSNVKVATGFSGAMRTHSPRTPKDLDSPKARQKGQEQDKRSEAAQKSSQEYTIEELTRELNSLRAMVMHQQVYPQPGVAPQPSPEKRDVVADAYPAWPGVPAWSTEPASPAPANLRLDSPSLTMASMNSLNSLYVSNGMLAGQVTYPPEHSHSHSPSFNEQKPSLEPVHPPTVWPVTTTELPQPSTQGGQRHVKVAEPHLAYYQFPGIPGTYHTPDTIHPEHTITPRTADERNRNRILHRSNTQHHQKKSRPKIDQRQYASHDARAQFKSSEGYLKPTLNGSPSESLTPPPCSFELDGHSASCSNDAHYDAPQGATHDTYSAITLGTTSNEDPGLPPIRSHSKSSPGPSTPRAHSMVRYPHGANGETMEDPARRKYATNNESNEEIA
eukprot:gnl/MRDRNA2_/MRDRNA2_33178_c0_seq1.p1 gnl/MRDRNA2_/MRDRNA2_33178_c0~~gnl/MRDRNA2_/MRDRNA2_33178_c0_seq1.p1  ORF type:complete len:1065 (-),score=154.19 gnl/MRDRNA2_/MRDRNA2_33178_c0_seq1:41-2875(-)